MRILKSFKKIYKVPKFNQGGNRERKNKNKNIHNLDFIYYKYVSELKLKLLYFISKSDWQELAIMATEAGYFNK